MRSTQCKRVRIPGVVGLGARQLDPARIDPISRIDKAHVQLKFATSHPLGSIIGIKGDGIVVCPHTAEHLRQCIPGGHGDGVPDKCHHLPIAAAEQPLEVAQSVTGVGRFPRIGAEGPVVVAIVTILTRGGSVSSSKVTSTTSKVQGETQVEFDPRAAASLEHRKEIRPAMQRKTVLFIIWPFRSNGRETIALSRPRKKTECSLGPRRLHTPPQSPRARPAGVLLR